MKKRNAAEIVRYILYGTLVLITVLCLVCFSVMTRRDLFRSNEKYIQGATDNLVTGMDFVFSSSADMTRTYADSYSLMLSEGSFGGSEESPRAVALSFLKRMADGNQFDDMAIFSATSDEDMQILGTWMAQPPMSSDEYPAFSIVSRQKFYIRGMGLDHVVGGVPYGRSGVEYYSAEQTGDRAFFLFYAPLWAGAGRNPSSAAQAIDGIANPVGLFFCMFSSANVGQRMTTTFFGTENRSLLVNKKTGEVLANSGATEKKNFREMLLLHNDDKAADDIMARLANLEPGKIESADFLSAEAGLETIGTMKMLSETQDNDWALIQVFPSEAIRSLGSDISRAGIELIVELIVLLIVSVLIMGWGSYDRRKAMRYRNERMTLLLSQIPGLLIEQKPGNQDVTVEGNAAHLYDIGKGALHQDDLYRAVYPDDRVRLTDAYDRVMREEDSATIEIRIRQTDGAYVWSTFTVQRATGVDGLPALIGTATDIDAQVRRVTEKEQIISAMAYAYKRMFYVDFETQIYTCLQPDEFTSEFPERGDIDFVFKHLLNQHIDERSRDSLVEFFREVVDKMSRAGQFRQIEYLLKDGRWERTIIVAIETANNKMKTALLVAQDTTEQKQEEERTKEALQEACETAQNASDAKTAFLSRMSHDVRTPMNAILGMTFLAQKHIGDSAYVQDCLEKIVTAGNRLLALLNEVLDMSRIESNSVMLNLEPATVSAQMEELTTLTKTLAQPHRHELRVKVDVEHDCVLCDGPRLQQLLLNFLSNAVKYTQDGGKIDFSVSEEREENGVAYYNFRVEDNGYGMTEEQVGHIFEPFYRAEDSRISKIEGTGLGMSIALNLARMLNGDIGVESEPGKGTRVNFLVGLKLDATCAAEKRNTERGKRADFSNARVLVVEDNELNREIARELIAMTGASVETADDGIAAVDMVKRHPEGYYDIVFMDIQMPGCNGYEATKRIRALPRKDVATLPVVAMTANAFTTDVADAKRAGMDAHLSKPIDHSQLMSVMERYCR